MPSLTCSNVESDTLFSLDVATTVSLIKTQRGSVIQTPARFRYGNAAFQYVLSPGCSELLEIKHFEAQGFFFLLPQGYFKPEVSGQGNAVVAQCLTWGCECSSPPVSPSRSFTPSQAQLSSRLRSHSQKLPGERPGNEHNPSTSKWRIAWDPEGVRTLFGFKDKGLC